MKNKVVLITGGSGTLGIAIAKGIVVAGGIVYILGRNEATLASRKAEFEAEDLVLCTIQGDVLDKVSINAAITTIIEKQQRVDVLINCAGGNSKGATVMPDESFFDLDIDQFKYVNDLNFLGTVLPTIICSKYMVEAGGGSVINISSMAAQAPLTRVGAYSAAKAAVDNFTKWLAVEFASKYGESIRVNAIAPGFFIAEQNKHLLLNDDGTYTSRGETIVKQTPFKRFGKPEELVSTILWLCDDRSSFVNGIVVPVDGGFSAFNGV